MEKDNETYGEGNAYDFGARIYDSRLGRWLSLDPLLRMYPSFSPFLAMGNSPIYFIDLEGEKIIVPNVKDRALVLKMINSKALGKFAFNSKGVLYQVKATGDDTRFSTYYRDKLVEAINDEQTIEIRIQSSYNQPTVEEDKNGEKSLVHNGKLTTASFNIDAEEGGGITIHLPISNPSKNVLIYISGNENKETEDTEGNQLECMPADILAHELVGHGIPYIIGSDTGNAVENENKVREQVKKEGQTNPSPLRDKEPNHTELPNP